MPDPLVYLAAIIAAVGTGAVLTAAVGSWCRHEGRFGQTLGAAAGLGAGLIAGGYVLRFRIAWPPANGLDRLLTIIVPLALGIELLGALPLVPRSVLWLLRGTLVAITGRTLLHGSVYLGDSTAAWSLGESAGMLLGGAAAALVVWYLLNHLSHRSPAGVSIPLALALTLQTAGVAIMLAGYLKGGAAALVLSASLAGTTVALGTTLRTPWLELPLALGIIGLSGLLWIGRFFGGLVPAEALVLLFAPLLCWGTELPGVRHWPPLAVGSMRLLFVAIPLVILLLLAKREFDRETAPLLVRSEQPRRAVVALTDGGQEIPVLRSGR
jgi:hypothetical protein